MARFSLPQATIDFSHAADVRQILVLGGRAPDPSWLCRAASGKIVWAADSGAEACRLADVRPAHVLGDFDSIGEEGRRWLERLDVKPELYPADKDYTDFQLCLNRIRGDLLVTGCWGKRFDHTFSNIFSAFQGKEWGADIRAFADESEAMFLLHGRGEAELTFACPVTAVSLLPLSAACGGVGIEGVKWPLSDVELLQGHPWTVSNVPLEKTIQVRIETGVLGVYCLFEENGLSG